MSTNQNIQSIITSVAFDLEIEDVDGEIFRRIDNTDAFINKFGVLHRRSQYTLKDINKNKMEKGYHRFKVQNKIYCLEPVLKKLFNSVNYKYETIDDKTIKMSDSVFKRIENTEAFVNEKGFVYRKDNNTMTDVKENKNCSIKINGIVYRLRNMNGSSFEIKPKLKDKNEIDISKQDMILKDGHYKNKPIIQNIPEDIKQITEYNGRILKNCYYYSENDFKLFHKIDNTNLYFEINDCRKFPKDNLFVNKDSKKFKVKTIDNKTINILLYSNAAKQLLPDGSRPVSGAKDIPVLIRQNKEIIKNKNEIDESKQNKILEIGKYKNRQVVHDVPDMKEYKEHRGTPLKDGYHYSKIKFGLYKKIPNTNLYYELENRHPEFLEKYEYKRKYYTVETTKKKLIKITFCYDMLK